LREFGQKPKFASRKAVDFYDLVREGKFIQTQTTIIQITSLAVNI